MRLVERWNVDCLTLDDEKVRNLNALLLERQRNTQRFTFQGESSM